MTPCDPLSVHAASHTSPTISPSLDFHRTSVERTPLQDCVIHSTKCNEAMGAIPLLLDEVELSSDVEGLWAISSSMVRCWARVQLHRAEGRTMYGHRRSQGETHV